MTSTLAGAPADATEPESGPPRTGRASGDARVRGRSRRAGRVAGPALVAAPLVVVAVFVAVPVLLALAFSLGITAGPNSTLAAIGNRTVRSSAPVLTVYGQLLAAPGFLRDLVATLGVTLLSTLLTLLAATAVAAILRLRGGRVGRALSVLAVVPLFVPVVIASWSILTFYDGTGLIRSLGALVGLDLPVWGFTLVAVVLGSVWTSLPFATLMVASAFQGVPDALIESARDAGAGVATVLMRILLPMSVVPVVIATTFTVIGVLGSFTVPYFTGPNAPTMLGVDISEYFTGFNRPQQSVAMAFVVFAFAAAASVLYLRATLISNAGRRARRGRRGGAPAAADGRAA